MSHSWIDALSVSENFPQNASENVFVNPPFNSIGKILQKIETEGVTITLMAPLWTAQPWSPKLVSLSIRVSVAFPHTAAQPLFIHPMIREVPRRDG